MPAQLHLYPQFPRPYYQGCKKDPAPHYEFTINWDFRKKAQLQGLRYQLSFLTAILKDLHRIPRVRGKEEKERAELLYILGWHKAKFIPDSFTIERGSDLDNKLEPFKEAFKDVQGLDWFEHPISSGLTAFILLELLLRYLFLSRSDWKIGKDEPVC